MFSFEGSSSSDPLCKLVSDLASARPMPVPDCMPLMTLEANLDKIRWVMLPKPVKSPKPLTFEALNQAYGYVLYRIRLKNAASGLLNVDSLADFAVVSVNGKKVGTLDRRTYRDSLFLRLPKGEVVLDILVENMGRINFGKYMLHNTKSIAERVMLGGKELKNWEMYSLPFDDINKLTVSEKPIPGAPVLKQGGFTLDAISDTYLDMRNWGKGVVWANGHNLGHYWGIGPQQTLYLPAEWLKKGKNKVAVLELPKTGPAKLSALAKPILDQLGTEGKVVFAKRSKMK